MDPFHLKYSLDFETALEVLTAATEYKKQRKTVSDKYKLSLIVKAAHFLEEWKKTCVPTHVFKLLKPTTILRFSLLARVDASPPIIASSSPILDQGMNGTTIILTMYINLKTMDGSYRVFGLRNVFKSCAILTEKSRLNLLT
jgi:hypothetical protein